MPRPTPSSRTYEVERWRAGASERAEDAVTTEEPLEIRIDGRAVAVTMRTPGHDEELAAGFCVTEGIVREPDDIVRIAPCDDAEDDNLIDVSLEPSSASANAIESAQRVTFLSSSCGLCGKQSIDRVEQAVEGLADASPMLSAKRLSSFPGKMRRRQTVFSSTGGLHSACLFSADGELLALREDIGRHNAVDKVIGHALLQRRRLGDAVALLVSGRASFEIVQKAAMARVPIVAAVSAPSSLAIELARRLDMTLIGFLRRGRFNIYAGGRRIEKSEAK